MIKLGIVDDRSEIRENLRRVFALFDDVEVVFEGRDGQDAVSYMQSSNPRPQLLLMDIQMREMDGIEATRRIKKEHPSVKILLLTVFKEEERILSAFEAGADGYLLKGERPVKMMELIRDTVEGRLSLSPEVAATTVNVLRQKLQKASSPEDYSLSERELEVLKLLSDGKSYQEVAKELFISPKTVRSHTDNIYRKLNVHSKVEAARIALENGWL